MIEKQPARPAVQAKYPGNKTEADHQTVMRRPAEPLHLAKHSLLPGKTNDSE